MVASKSRKPNSPEGRALQEVVELRVGAARGWSASPYDLTLCILLQPGTLPTFPDDLAPDLSPSLRTWLYNADSTVARSSGQIAQRLATASDASDRYWLWMALGESWALRCYAQGGAPDELTAPVRSVAAEVMSANEFPLTRVRRSEILDLDHSVHLVPRL